MSASTGMIIRKNARANAHTAMPSSGFEAPFVTMFIPPNGVATSYERGVMTFRTKDAALRLNDGHSGRCRTVDVNGVRHHAIKQPTRDIAARPPSMPITSKANVFSVDQFEPWGKQIYPLAVTRNAMGAEQRAKVRVTSAGKRNHHNRPMARSRRHALSSSGSNV